MTKKVLSLQVVAAAGLILATGCDWLRPGGPPDEVYVEISSDDASRLTIIVSQNFEQFEEPVCEGDPECPVVLRIVSADTSTVSPPYSNTIEFTDRYQILVETHPEGEVTGTVRMVVEIDGREWFDDVKVLRPVNEDGDRETLRFLYEYQDLDGLNSGGPGGP